MRMPGLTAEASLYETRETYMVPTAETRVTRDSVHAAFTSYDFTPGCGPCVCRILDVGIRRYFFCHRDCSILFTPGPGLPPQRILYQMPCARF